ncbi:hypothetical protein RB195_017737 [Necator americanus]|uniref:Peptidase M13 C-terminal domain-containing protein n=1 Tax=Necator americanus TaxID=51031 RepID=A0ABR1C7K4_NECAM
MRKTKQKLAAVQSERHADPQRKQLIRKGWSTHTGHTKTTKKKGETERIDGFTQWKIQQRTRCFSWEFIWGEKLNDFELMLWIEIEEHAPSPLRVNNVVSNIEGFAEAFRCPPGTPMNPKERCSIF